MIHSRSRKGNQTKDACEQTNKTKQKNTHKIKIKSFPFSQFSQFKKRKKKHQEKICRKYE